MSKVFWGEKGQYGPFSAQEDGWPNAGEVMRHYRKIRRMSAEMFAHKYGACSGKPITTKRVYQMENTNDVPTDMNRRRAIASILNVPPVLLGLASLGNVSAEPAPFTPPITLKRNTITLDTYEQDARQNWALFFTSSAQKSLPQIEQSISDLTHLQKQSTGAQLLGVHEQLYSLLTLTGRIYLDQAHFNAAHKYMDAAVQITQSMPQSTRSQSIAAVALYRRAMVSMEQTGRFTSVVTNKAHTKDAINDFEEALLLAIDPLLKGLIYKELSIAKGLMAQSKTDILVAQKIMDKAASVIGTTDGLEIRDSYDQILLLGTMGGFNSSWGQINQAINQINMGQPRQALEMLDDLHLNNHISSDQTRNHAWINIIRSQAALEAKLYDLSVQHASCALSSCNDIGSTLNIGCIRDIYRHLLKSPVGASRSVIALGAALKR